MDMEEIIPEITAPAKQTNYQVYLIITIVILVVFIIVYMIWPRGETKKETPPPPPPTLPKENPHESVSNTKELAENIKDDFKEPEDDKGKEEVVN